MSLRAALFAALGALSIWFAAFWIRRLRGVPLDRRTSIASSVLSFATTFLDTLGIGNFATTTSGFKLLSIVRDEAIPATLNVGFTIPTIAQAFIYMTIIEMDVRTLVAMILASVIGAWIGSGLVAGLPRRKIQLSMGAALVIAALVILLELFALIPSGGAALSLDGGRLLIAVSGNFVLGALMTLGIGLYAPCMILMTLLGMSPAAAFPVMMGSCAFLMPIASARFVARNTYSPAAAVAMTAGGLPAVFVAAFLVRSLRLEHLRWLVIAVVSYAAVQLLVAGLRPADRRRRLSKDSESLIRNP